MSLLLGRARPAPGRDLLFASPPLSPAGLSLPEAVHVSGGGPWDTAARFAGSSSRRESSAFFYISELTGHVPMMAVSGTLVLTLEQLFLYRCLSLRGAPSDGSAGGR